MKLWCPNCDEVRDIAAADSRPGIMDDMGRSYIRRRRKCLTCGHRFTTYEIVVGDNRRLPEPLRIELISESDLEVVAESVRAQMLEAIHEILKDKLGVKGVRP